MPKKTTAKTKPTTEIPPETPEQNKTAAQTTLLPEVVPTAQEESLMADDDEMGLHDPDTDGRPRPNPVDGPVDVAAVEADGAMMMETATATLVDSVSPTERAILNDALGRLLRTLRRQQDTEDVRPRMPTTEKLGQTSDHQGMERLEPQMTSDANTTMLRQVEMQYAVLKRQLAAAEQQIQRLRSAEDLRDPIDTPDNRRRRMMDDDPEIHGPKGRPSSRMSNASEQTVQEQVELTPCGQFWESTEIEGLIFESIPKHNHQLAERARQSVSQSRKIVP